MASNYCKTLELTSKLFKISGFWIEKDSQLAYRVYGFLVRLIAVYFFSFSQLLYLFKITDIMMLIDAICVDSLFLLFWIKTILFSAEKVSKLNAEVKELIDFWEDPKTSQRLGLKLRTNRIHKYFLTFWFAAAMQSVRYIFRLTISIQNIHPPFKVLYKCWFPFDYENNFTWFMVVSSYHALVPILLCGVHMSMDFLPSCYLSIATGLLEELNERLSMIGQQAKHLEVKEMLKCIEGHIRIKSFIRKVESAYSWYYFFQFSVTVIILCTTSFVLSVSWFITSINVTNLSFALS